MNASFSDAVRALELAHSRQRQVAEELKEVRVSMDRLNALLSFRSFEADKLARHLCEAQAEAARCEAALEAFLPGAVLGSKEDAQ